MTTKKSTTAGSATPFTSVLVANRGEIARRVFASARARGLTCIAVYSDPDADAPHVREAEIAVRLPGSTPAETYLDAELILAAARDAGAEAIHPGYGFLSENADFARAVTDAGLVWIGPSPEAIDEMGSKIAAKERMGAAGVPMLTDLDPDTVTADQLPVLVKASAGGGGRGMRVVRELDALAEEIASARREAASAFGDDAVFCERYLETGRHIEVQVMADAHGTVWAVGERECSIQRRHQKIIEEAPSPLVEQTEGMRDRLFEAARAAASSIGYTGAGTVEFLATDTGEFFFLEMNTRLQVEHPVTEATTGLDLVGLQLDVAAGEKLSADEPPAARGWSIEARLYAEDPAADWRPTAGTLHHLAIDGVDDEFTGPMGVAGFAAGAAGRPRIRLDSALDTSAGPATVSTFYDPMLAKVISAADTREQAAAALARALAGARIEGLVTNRDLLVAILRDAEFRSGHTTTAFLAPDRLAALAAPPLGESQLALAAAATALAAEDAAHRASPLSRVRTGFRTVGTATPTRTLRAGETELRVTMRADRAGLAATAVERIDGDEATALEIPECRLEAIEHRRLPAPDNASATEIRARLVAGTLGRAISMTRRGSSGDLDAGAEWDVITSGGTVSLNEPDRYLLPGAEAARGSLLAPMPGAIIRIAVAVGDTVTAGQPLLWMEAMKMEHSICADADGTVTELPVSTGDSVDADTVLAVVTPAEEEEA